MTVEFLNARRHRFALPLGLLFLGLALCLTLTGCHQLPAGSLAQPSVPPTSSDAGLADSGATETYTLADLPPYTGEAVQAVNGNKPYFTAVELTKAAESGGYEIYSDLDLLGRCGPATANVCQDTMPTEERGEIGMIRPSGWHTVRYDDLVEGKYLYNRCHLIGYQLTGENANPQNLITGTRYLNVQGMLPYENEVATYVERTGNHVLYRVTPVFSGANLVADGVLMEAQSIEDGGEGVTFCVYAYNVQPGITLDYATGDSWVDETNTPPAAETPEGPVAYILNTRTKKFHRPDCAGAANIAEYNREETDKDRETLVADGYSPCGSCKP